MKKSYVYKITCKITGEFYFGSSFNAKSDQYWGSGRKIKEQISLYGKENFVKEILGEFDNRTIALQVENQYIEQFRHDDKCLNERIEYHFGSFSEETRARMSAAKRGEKNPLYGKHHTDEARERMSAVKRGENHPMYGKHLSDKTRARMSAAKLGKIFSEEHRAKLSASLRGKHHTDESRAKMSAANSGEKNPMYGKHHTDESRSKMSAVKCGENNPMYGKHWRKNPVTGKREYYD